jgi:hypothetical protein
MAGQEDPEDAWRTTRSPPPVISITNSEDGHPASEDATPLADQLLLLRDRLEEERRKRKHAEVALKTQASSGSSNTAVTPQPVFDANFFNNLLRTAVAAVPPAQQPAALRRTRMPAKDSVEAPITFNGGNGHALVDFFARLEECFAESNVLADDERLRYLPRYMSDELAEWTRGLQFYRTGHYLPTKQYILQTYGNPQARPRYTAEDLKALIREQQEEELVTRDQLYTRGVRYDLIADTLVRMDVLTTEQADRGYWRSFPPKVLEKIRLRLEITNPDFDTEMSVYTRAMVRAAANVVLRPTFFDEPPPGDARAVSQRLTEEGARGKDKAAGGVTAEEGGANSVNELIDQLARLNITDVAYARVYAQLTRLQPTYASVIAAPQVAAFAPRNTLKMPLEHPRLPMRPSGPKVAATTAERRVVE